MLFERGAIIKADKLFIQDMLLRGDRKAEQALEFAEMDGKVDKIQAVLLNERKREAGEYVPDQDSEDEQDTKASAAAEWFKKRPSVARKNSDEDDEQTEGMHDGRKSLAIRDGVEAPHPYAGGYNGSIPQSMVVEKGHVAGHILLRSVSKKMFRKWKPVFFVIEKEKVLIYEERMKWETGQVPRKVIPIHECMWIAKPTLKKTYSMIDDGRRVYFSTLKENAQSAVQQAAASGMERPITFSPALEANVVGKFGSHYPDEISAFAHAVYSVILAHQKQARERTRTSRRG